MVSLVVILHHWLLKAVSSVDAGELDLSSVLVIVFSEKCGNNWFCQKHTWDQKDGNNQKSCSDSILDVIIAENNRIIIIIIATHEISSDHDLND